MLSLQIAQAQLERAGSIHHRLLSRNESPGTTLDFPSDKKAPYNGFNRDEPADMLNESQVLPSNKDNGQVASPSCPPGSQRKVAVATEAAENNPEGTSAAKVAAEVAAKLAASSSSAAMLTSVLSSLAAEEANGGVQSSSYSPDRGRPLEKRLRRESISSEVVVPAPDPPPYPLPPPMPQYLTSPLPYAYQSILPPPPPPPLQGRHVMMKQQQHSVGLLPQPIPPGCAPAAYQPFQASGMPYYSQPPLPAPPAPRQ